MIDIFAIYSIGIIIGLILLPWLLFETRFWQREGNDEIELSKTVK